ncbi:Cyclin-D1-1 [Bienertia sinuspersici]
MSYSCFSDVVCSEESGGVLSAGDSPDISSELESPANIDEHESSIIAGFIHEERSLFNCIEGVIGSSSPSSAATATSLSSVVVPDSSARSRSVAWILKENVRACYKLMQQIVVDHSRRKTIKVIPQFRVTAQITKNRSYNDSSPSSSSTSSSSSPYSNKRRKLNNQLWMDDDHDDDDDDHI